MDITEKINSGVKSIAQKVSSNAKIGVILGSGLGGFVDGLSEQTVIPFSEVEGLPLSTVKGHEGRFVFGKHNGIGVMVMQGRLHYYEGYSQQEITIPVRIMKKLGVEALIITNACGGINRAFSEGALMIISDHINYSGSNPLIGVNLDEYGVRFPDVSDIYTKDIRSAIKQSATEMGINLFEGVYIMYSGPNYETAAEIRFFREIGADAVGMSTVPEALVAAHCNMKVVGISCVTNMATGVIEKKIDHNKVIETTNRVISDFTHVVRCAIEQTDTCLNKACNDCVAD